MKLRLSSLVVLSLAAIAASSSAVVYDAHDDFSGTTNTATSIWQYAYADGSGYHLFTDTNGTSWRDTAVDIYMGVYDVASPYVLQHPGPSGQVSVLRFTAPTTGLFKITSAFTNGDNATTDFSLVLNGTTSLFSGTISGGSSVQSYTGTIFLSAGDTLDSAVGFGGNGYYFDSTLSQLTIQSVPGPASAAAFAAAGLGALRRRKRS